MPVVAVNAIADQAVPEDAAGFARHLAALPDEAPVMILLHGYGYSPSRAKADPHRYIFSLSPDLHTHSWPRRLGFGAAATPAQGLCVAFGWEAFGRLGRAYHEAGRAGVALARLIGRIRTSHPGPVHLIGHSFGGRVALAALPHLGAGDVNRLVLMAGAELCEVAKAALQSPAGRGAEVLNVISRENDLFDFALERFLRPLSPGARVLGSGLDLPNVVTLQIDHAGHRQALRGIGFATDAKTHLVCHWSAYTRPGLFPFYREFLRSPNRLPLPFLRETLSEAASPRWSGLRPIYAALRPLAAG